MNPFEAIEQLKKITKPKLRPIDPLALRADSLFGGLIQKATTLQELARIYRAVMANRIISQETKDNLVLNMKNKAKEMIKDLTLPKSSTGFQNR